MVTVIDNTMRHPFIAPVHLTLFKLGAESNCRYTLCPSGTVLFSMTNPTDYICFSFKDIKKREYRAPTSLCTSKGDNGTRRVSDQIEKLNRIRAESWAASKAKNPVESKDVFVKYAS